MDRLVCTGVVFQILFNRLLEVRITLSPVQKVVAPPAEIVGVGGNGSWLAGLSLCLALPQTTNAQYPAGVGRLFRKQVRGHGRRVRVYLGAGAVDNAGGAELCPVVRSVADADGHDDGIIAS